VLGGFRAVLGGFRAAGRRVSWPDTASLGGFRTVGRSVSWLGLLGGRRVGALDEDLRSELVHLKKTFSVRS